jgi:hypothetical protein
MEYQQALSIARSLAELRIGQAQAPSGPAGGFAAEGFRPPTEIPRHCREYPRTVRLSDVGPGADSG